MKKEKFTYRFLYVCAILFVLPYSQYAQSFTEQSGIVLPGIKQGSIEWGDFNNDDLLDLLIYGSESDNIMRIHVYRNNGNNTFTDLTANISPALSYSWNAYERTHALWSDFNNDGYLDILYAGRVSSGTAVRIYQNNSDETFSKVFDMSYSTSGSAMVTVGDYDNDGDADFLLAKSTKTSLYQNHGSFTFKEQTDVILEPCYNGVAKFIDYNNDGRLDIFLTGRATPYTNTFIYKNLGTNVFELIPNNYISTITDGSADWADFNQDGKLDVTTTNYSRSYFHLNAGNDQFNLLSDYYPGIRYSSADWGDTDNDGDPDYIVTGTSGSVYSFNQYMNNGDSTFSKRLNPSIDGVENGYLDMGDYNGDGNLDIVISGETSTGEITKVYSNDTTTLNTAPSAPDGLTSTSLDADVILQWNPSTDDHQNSSGLSYNVAIGSAPGASDILHPASSSSGYYRRTTLGNAQTDTTFLIRNIPKGTYYWRVQAIDNSYLGSSFSSEFTFSYTYSFQAYGMSVPTFDASSAQVNWSRGNGEKVIVFMKEGAHSADFPADNVTYIGSDIFQSGTQIGTSGWYCVYNGVEDNVLVTGLTKETQYSLMVIEYDGTAGNENYNTTLSDKNTGSFTTGFFTQLRNLNLDPGLSGSANNEQYSRTFWIDYDNDDDLDLLIAGSSGTKLYRNDGSDSFIESGNVFNNAWGAAVGDLNNDGYIDISVNGNSFIIYLNNQDGTFSELAATGIPAGNYGSVDFADYDLDGDLDISITGSLSPSQERIARIYENNGDSTFTFDDAASLAFTGVRGSGATAQWADINNDAYPDILISGLDPSHDAITDIFLNNRDKSFYQLNDIDIPTIYETYYSWGDINNDGHLDLLMASAHDSSKIYINNGDSTLTAYEMKFPPSEAGDMSIGDYDNDGDPDIALAGRNAFDQPYVYLYLNHDSTFVVDTTFNIPGVLDGTANFADYDNDGDLDIVFSGLNPYGEFAAIYRNERNTINMAPATPSGIFSEIDGKDVHISWNAVSTDETPSPSISYNLMIGTTVNGEEFLSSHSSLTGFRRYAARGNLELDTFAMFKNLPFDRYYYRLQAIDQNYRGSAFSTSNYFDIVPIQASKLSAEISTPSSLLLRWRRGNGERCLVFCKQTNSDTAAINDSISYIADSEFGFGEEIGSTGWYCVYNGRNDSVVVNGLVSTNAYSFQVFEFDGTYGTEYYFDETGDGNPAVFGTGNFTLQANISFKNHNDVYSYRSAWGDYNNDGFIDLFIVSYDDTTAIYANNGNNTFTKKKLLGDLKLYAGSGSWGDYDNDGDLDVLVSGTTTSPFGATSPLTRIYRNDGSDVFTEQSTIALEGVYNSSGEWGDYDSDGYLDILITGATGDDPNYAPVSKIYRNNGDNTFTEKTDFVLTGVHLGEGKWGDLDGDGDLDILISGSLDNEVWSGNYSAVYINNGDSAFIEKLQPDLSGESETTFSFADFDNDNDLDLAKSRNGYSRIFRNNGRAEFEYYTGIGLPYNDPAYVGWGDYNNDGWMDYLLTNPNLDTKLFENTQGKIFTAYDTTWFVQVDDPIISSNGNHSVYWVDYDNDGDLDVLELQRNGENKLYRNNIVMESGQFPENKQAGAPVNLDAVNTPEGLTLSWSLPYVDETPSSTMTYNLWMGTRIDTADILFPPSDATGFLRLPQLGNIGFDTTYLVKNLDPGIYYWGVQAIDQGLRGGKWSETDSFELRNIQAFFDFDTVCSGFNTSFTDQSVSTTVIDNWYWDYGDGNISTDQSPAYTFSSSGIHSVKLVVTSGSFSDSVIHDVLVYGKPSPQFEAPTVCQATATSFLNTTNLNGTSTSSWYWDLGDGNSSSLENPISHPYLTAGNYDVKLIVHATNGCADSITNSVTVSNYPSATIATGGNPQFCEGNNVKLSVPDDNAYTYQWHINGVDISNADSSVYFAALGGNYTVTVINPEGNCTTVSPSSATVVVSPTPSSPFILNNGASTFCQGDSASLSISSYSNSTYQWKLNGGAIGSSSTNYNAKVSGTYSVDVTNSSGCTSTSSNTINLTVNPSPTIPTVGVAGPKVFCDGDSLLLNVTNDPTVTYSWLKDNVPINGANSNSLYAKENGKYELELSNSYSCVSRTDSIAITVNPAPLEPEIIFTGETSFCSSDSLLLSTTKVEGLSYQWTRNGGEVGTDSTAYTAKNSGVFSLIATNDYNCASEAKQTVELNVLVSPVTPAVSSSRSTEFCSDDSTRLSTDDNPLLTYQWKRNGSIVGAGTNSYLVTNDGNYTVTVRKENGCSSVSNITEVTVLDAPPVPSILLSGSNEFCKGESLELSVVAQAGVSYDWMMGGNLVAQNSSSYTVTSTGSYIAIATNRSTQCVSNSSPVGVTVHDVPEVPAIAQEGEKIFCQGDTLKLTFTEKLEDSYQWIKDGDRIQGAGGSPLEITASGIYILEVTNPQSCKALSASAGVTVKPNPDKPKIISENYNKNECPSLDPVILTVENITNGATYQWIKSGEDYPGKDSTVLEGYLDVGVYRVEADLNGCSKVSDAITIDYAQTPLKPTIIAEGPTIWYLACSNDSASAYRWFYNDMEISGANEFIYLANDKVGKYEVAIAEKADGCYALSDPIWIPLGTGIVENPFAGLKIYPNPTPGKFTLEMENSLMGELIIDIFNEQGSKILNVKFFKETARFKTEIDLSGQQSALYLIGLTLDKYRIQKKLLVE